MVFLNSMSFHEQGAPCSGCQDFPSLGSTPLSVGVPELISVLGSQPTYVTEATNPAV